MKAGLPQVGSLGGGSGAVQLGHQLGQVGGALGHADLQRLLGMAQLHLGLAPLGDVRGGQRQGRRPKRAEAQFQRAAVGKSTR